jgi:cyclopropane-fatty-acyl-phospholipid synthase
MKSSTETLNPTSVPKDLSSGWFVRTTRSMVLAGMRGITRGKLVIHDHGEVFECGTDEGATDIYAEIHIQSGETWTAVARRGSIGAAEAFVQAHWTTPDLTQVIRIFVANRSVLEGMENSLARFVMPLWRVAHFVHANTRKGSRRNIAAHYDLGNDFFKLFLDETMMYSAAVFERPDMTLVEAQHAKNERICRKLDLKSTDHLLEIGTGWGGFAIHAARHHGCRVTTTTISRQQYDLACERVRAAGLEDRIKIVMEDYRDLSGTWDKVVSIEMIEAVGHKFYPDYFAAISHLLKPDGLALIQAITITDQIYEQALRQVDFIQKYIFPGSCIPSITALLTAMTNASDLKLTHLEDITPHYATTLRLWREALLKKRHEAAALGHDDEFLRLWEFYFAYCEGGFMERAIGDVHMLLARPLNRRDSIVPSLSPAGESV